MNLEQFRTLLVPGSRWVRTHLGRTDRNVAEVTVTDVADTVGETGLPQLTVRFREVWWNGSPVAAQPHAVRDVAAYWNPARDMSFDDGRMVVSYIESAAGTEWRYLGPPVGPMDLGTATDRSAVAPRRVADLAPGDVVYGPWLTWQRNWSGPQPGYTVDHVDLSAALAVVYTREGWPMWLSHDTEVAVATTGRREVPPVELPTVYLTINTVSWLWRDDVGLDGVPICISRNRLAGYGGTLKPARDVDLLIDSGGFTELKRHGRHRLTPEQFVTEVRTHLAHIAPGRRVKVVQQDWMCEDVVIYGGKTKDGVFVGTRPTIDPDGVMSFDELVYQHQLRSVANLLELRRLAPDLHIVPVLQGSTLMQYARHAGMLEQAGVRLAAEELVGLGSVCRRQGTRDIEQIVRYLARLGYRLHGFGVGVEGLGRYGDRVASTDSNAFSFNGRTAVGLCPHGIVKWETNCPMKARNWWDNAQARLRRGIASRMRTPMRCSAPAVLVVDVWAAVVTGSSAGSPVRVPAPRRPVTTAVTVAADVVDVWQAVLFELEPSTRSTHADR